MRIERFGIWFLLVPAALLLSACGSNSSNGQLLPVYGPGPLTDEGKMMTSIGAGDDSATSLAIQGDGKILVVGDTFNGTDTDIAIVRYLPNGVLDPAFGGDGIVTLDIFNADDTGTSVQIQVDGNIVVGGNAHNGSDTDFALVRYQPNGDLDTTFGQDGILVTDVAGMDDSLQSVMLQPDGKIVAGGMSRSESSCTAGIYTWDYTLVRYHAGGNVDLSFGQDGIVLTDFQCDQDYGYTVHIQEDGKILLAGSIYNSPAEDFSMARYLPDGTLDSSFGSGGLVVTELGAGYDFIRDMLVQNLSDGKMIVAGGLYDQNGTSFDFGLLRYLSNGDLDVSFGSAGIQTVDFSGAIDIVDSMVELPNGKIIVAGWAETGIDRDFAVARLFPDGTLDLGFGTDGKMSTGFGFGDDYGHAVALEPGGAVYVCGAAFNGQDFDFGLVEYEVGE